MDKIDNLQNKLEQKENILQELRELIEIYSWNTYYKCDSRNKYLKSEIISDLKQILDKNDLI